MSAEILYHPRIFEGCAAELERSRAREALGGPREYVSCVDCLHAVRNLPTPSVWCRCYNDQRPLLKPHECPRFEARGPC